MAASSPLVAICLDHELQKAPLQRKAIEVFEGNQITVALWALWVCVCNCVCAHGYACVYMCQGVNLSSLCVDGCVVVFQHLLEGGCRRH